MVIPLKVGFSPELLVQPFIAVPGRVGEVRIAADEPEAVDLDPGVLARRLDAPATVKAVLEQGGRVLLRSRAVRDPGPSGGRVRGVAKQPQKKRHQKF